MREMFMSCWRNAIRWVCLTGKFAKRCVGSYFILSALFTVLYLFLFSTPPCSIASLAVAQNMRELYRLVLVDTPLAPYFSECITSEVLFLCLAHVLSAKCKLGFLWIVR